MNKYRREADVLCCVRRCLRGEYVFAAHAEIDRFLWHAREPYDDEQLTAVSNPLRAEQLGGRQRRRQRHRARSLAPLKAADARTPARRLCFVAPQHRLSPHCVQAGHTDATVVPPPSPLPLAARRLFRVTPSVVDNLKSQCRSRLASMPVRPQFNVTELAAVGK